MKKTKLWTSNFMIVTAVNFLIFLGYYLLMVIIVVHATDHLNATPGQAGLAAGIFILAALPSRIFTGRMIELVGRKKMLIIGLVIFSLATLLYFRIDNIAFLYIVRVLHGIGWGIATTCTATIAAYIIPDTRRGEGISYYSMSISLASSIGPLIGMNFYQYSSFNSILLLSMVSLLVIFIIVSFLKIPKIELTTEELRKMKRFKFSNFFELKVLPIALVGFVVYFSYSSIVSFLSSYSERISLMAAGSFFFMVYSASILVSRMISGRLFDSKGENFVMYPSFIMFASGLVIISRAHSGFILLISGVFMGVGFGTFVSSTQAIAINLAPDHRKGLATSTFQAIADMGIGIGPSILGLVIPALGFRGMYLSLSAVVMAAMLLYYFLHGGRIY